MNEFIVYGLIGGAIPDLLRIINNRYQLQLPAYLRSLNFYIGFTFLLVLGMVTVQLLSANSIIEALSYGYSAPQIISGLLGNFAKAPKKMADKRNLSPILTSNTPLRILEFWKY